MVVTESSGVTDIGRKRKGNEDELLVDDNLGLYIVADGMGGHQAGEVASKMVVDIVQDHIKKIHAGETPEKPIHMDETLSQSANNLLAGILSANKNIFDVSNSDGHLKGMGSTVSAIYFDQDKLIAANVGDSPIYLIRKGNIELLSVLHTVMAEHAAPHADGAPQLGPEFRHMLTRGMGVSETVQPDIIEMQTFQDDIFVICSDGLSDKLSPDEIREIVMNHDPMTSCHIFVDVANARGGDDNITVIVVQVKTGAASGSLMRSMSNVLYSIRKKMNFFGK